LSVIPGVYLHSKSGSRYRVIGTAMHTETGEKYVIYYSVNDSSQLWSRPAEMFEEAVWLDGVIVDRFKLMQVIPFKPKT